MKRKIILQSFLVCLVLFISINAYTQELKVIDSEHVGMSSDKLDILTKTLQTYVDNKQLSGSVALVARKGQIAYFESIGRSDVENNIPMKKDAIFRIASQTKAIISVGIMILQEEGKLIITDPVGRYIPEFMKTTVAVKGVGDEYDVIKAKRAITIRDLLTHTAGIGYGYGLAADQWKEAGIQGWYFAHRDEPIIETVKRMATLPFDAQPGEQFVYGYNTDILGALIEVVSGMPLDKFLQSKILDPLDMKDTHFYLPGNKKDRLAVVYSSTEDGIKIAKNENGMEDQGAYVEGPRKSFSGGAGLLSTAADYLKFLQMMLNKGTLNGHQIISKKTVELMTTDHLDEAKLTWIGGTGFGLGFSVVNDLGIRGILGSEGEYGWGGAYHSVYWVDPKEELVVVYFTQLIPAIKVDDHQKLRSLIYPAIID